MAFAIGIAIAIVAGGAAYGAGLAFLYRMWGYYGTGGLNPTAWEDMETGGSAEVTWAAIDMVGAGPVNTVAPTITGDPYEGETLSVSDGTWLPNGGIISGYTYQWYADGSPIEGETANTFLITADYVGAYLSAQSRATTEWGTTNADSDNTPGPVIIIPVNSVLPSLTGTPTEGEELSVTTGTWSGGGTINYSYKWLADDVEIGGSTLSTFTLTASEVGALINVEVTATNEAGSDAATSNTLGPVVGL